MYSLPLWVHSVWAVYVAPAFARRTREEAWGGWVTTGQALLAGCAFAALLVLSGRQSLDFIYFQF